jgi:FAD:protein FMN transferase
MWPIDPESDLAPAPHGMPAATDIAALANTLVSWSARAMGCEFQVLTSIEGQRAVAPVLQSGFSLIQQLEKQMTTYDPASELEWINREAARAPVSVAPNLLQLLTQARELSQSTDGAFDITAGPLSQLWKSHQKNGWIPSQLDIESTLAHTGWEKLSIDEESRSVRFLASQMKLDLGGIGKGHAIDELNRLLSESGATDFLIHGGQSSIFAGGCRNPAGVDKGWQVGISHPLIPDRRLALITLNDEAIGTSGSGRQSFVHIGRRYGHVIDPRTGWPADHRLSVTAIAPQAAFADAIATALFVMNDEELREFAGRHPHVCIVALQSGTAAGRIIARIFNRHERKIEWQDSGADVISDPASETSEGTAP